MKEYLLLLWQLPQNLIGLLVVFFTDAKEKTQNGITYYLSTKWSFGVSLGDLIIIGSPKCVVRETTLKHEHGHQLQSLKYGPLYLLIIGIPSFVRNIWDRIAHKNWTYVRRYIWYYSGFPEREADKLGGVIR